MSATNDDLPTGDGAAKGIVPWPPPLAPRWGRAELERLTSMVEQTSLFYWNGPQTAALLDQFRALYPLRHCMPCSSGSAALHIAVAALRLEPGSEVIVPAITDMGSVIGILYQQLVPVFADVDATTFNLDPVDVRRRLTDKTRAIMPVHFAGNPCDMEALSAIARERRLFVIEDCAQAWGARWQGKPVGLAGHFGCFSFNDFKHLSCGDGGIVGTNDAQMGPGLALWGDKAYDRVSGARNPRELAPNYRMSEPQAAVAAAQLTKLADIVARRVALGSRLTQALRDTPGLRLPHVRPGDTHSFWFYLFRVELERFRVNRDQLATALAAEGVPCTAGYLERPVYEYDVFQEHRFFGGRWPLRDAGLTTMDYRNVLCPEAKAILADSIRLTINEAMGDAYIDKVAHAIRVVAKRLAR